MDKGKLKECSKLLEDSMTVLQKDPELWKQFLHFATQFTHYRFRDQLLIYAQNPQATACATFAQWKKIGRYVRSGEHSIVLLDETGPKPKLRHVFDVTSTGPEKEFAYRPKPILPEEREALAKQLSAVYAKENPSYLADAERWEGDLEHTLSQVALYMTQQYYGVSLEQAAEQSENGEIPTYYVATATSAMYLLLSKYGFEKEANQLDFSCMEQLNEEMFENVGTAASAILSKTARMIRQIHPQIQRETQTEKQPERSHEKNEERTDNGGYSQENQLSSGGGLYGTGHRTAGGRRGRTGTEKVRNDEKEVSGGEQPAAVREHGDTRDAVSRDEEGRRSSRQDPGTDASEAGGGSRSNSGIEANESAGVGAQDGSLQPSGRGSDSGGTGVQLTISDYLELRPTDRESVSDSDTPKIEEQEENQIESEQAVEETSAAFSIPENEITQILQTGSLFEGGKKRITALYQTETDAKKRAEFLKQEYGIGDRTVFFADGVRGWYDSNSNGLHIRKENALKQGQFAVHLSWSQIEKRIGQLIQEDQYLLESEKSELLSDKADIQEKQGAIVENEEDVSVSDSDTPKSVIKQDHTEIEPTTEEVSDGVPAQNFHITDEHLGEGSPKQKFRANMDAIHTLKMLETENRNATTQEQETLAKYVGWGGLADAFDEKKDAWASEYRELKEVLTEEEYTAARESTLNAHYTSPVIIRGIYNALEQFGFQGGSILEPSMAIGNFFGMLPESMESSRLYGVELDSISGRIAKKLYPQAHITVAGFETTNQHDFYDLAIGNVPFGNYKVNDRAYNRLGFSIHNYFFAKALDQIRPGGIIAFVTSHYTMDSKNPAARRYLSQRAELLGAIRLPDNAFRANAGAEVVSDILFLKKRDHIMDIDEDWVHLGMKENGYAMNSYFVNNPEMILGTLEEQTTKFGKGYTVKSFPGKTLSEVLSEAIKKIRGHYEVVIPSAGVSESDTRETEEILPADPTVTNYSYTLVNGEVYYRENSVMRKMERSQTQKSRTKGLLEIRSALNTVIQLQLENAPDEEVKEAQKKLEFTYDQFTKEYGLINSRQNAQMLDGDSSYFLLCSLENIGDKGELLSKADIFTKRTIRAQQEITSAETPADALAVSIGEKGHVDLSYMAELLGKPGTEDEIAQALSGVIFRDPQEKDEQLVWKTADEYLSGNVRTKLRAARMAQISDPAYEVNVKALEQAQPKDLTASEIDVRLGATWIGKNYIEEFMYETFHTTYHQRRQIQVSFAAVTGEWQISGKSSIYSGDVVAHAQYGTARMSAYEILEQTLNLRNVTVYDRVDDGNGNVKSVVNPKETMFAQQKQQTIKEAFQNWIWKDPFRREELEKTYNERFNSLRPAEFSGEHIHFVGMNPLIGLRTHQKNAVAHILYGGNTLLAHEVGAGKTYTMAAAAMESKRLGLCRKSLFVVPNHLTLQWANEFLHLYPAANLLVASKKDFEATNRKKFCARIATGDYDAIIIGHSQFERIPVSSERQEKVLQSQLEEIEDAIQQSAWQRGQAFTVKQLEKTRKTIKLKLEKLRAEERKDNVVTFEQLGVDRLFVDEAHCYKNCAKRCRTRQD